MSEVLVLDPTETEDAAFVLSMLAAKYEYKGPWVTSLSDDTIRRLAKLCPQATDENPHRYFIAGLTQTHAAAMQILNSNT